MKKILGVLVALAMICCFCIPAFASDDIVIDDSVEVDNEYGSDDTAADTGSDILGSLSGALGGLDLSGLDVSGITDSLSSFDLSGLTSGLDLSSLTGSSDGTGTGVDLSGITDTLGGLTGGLTGSDATGESSTGLDSILGSLSGFDSTGALSSFTEGLSMDSFTDLFSGLLGSLGSSGIDLSNFSFGEFDIASLLGGVGGGSSGTDLGVAGIMDTFSGVLEGLGLSSDIINGLLNNDIVNFFANLYLGISSPVETTAPVETTTSVVTTNPPEITPDTGVEDASAIIAACATLSVAAAAAFVCTRKKHA